MVLSTTFFTFVPLRTISLRPRSCPGSCPELFPLKGKGGHASKHHGELIRPGGFKDDSVTRFGDKLQKSLSLRLKTEVPNSLRPVFYMQTKEPRVCVIVNRHGRGSHAPGTSLTFASPGSTNEHGFTVTLRPMKLYGGLTGSPNSLQKLYRLSR